MHPARSLRRSQEDADRVLGRVPRQFPSHEVSIPSMDRRRAPELNRGLYCWCSTVDIGDHSATSICEVLKNGWENSMPLVSSPSRSAWISGRSREISARRQGIPSPITNSSNPRHFCLFAFPVDYTGDTALDPILTSRPHPSYTPHPSCRGPWELPSRPRGLFVLVSSRLN
jgi:hypothetical protein